MHFERGSVSLGLGLRACSYGINRGKMGGEEVDVVAEFFPVTFLRVVHAGHEVLDFFSGVSVSGREVHNLLLPVLEAVSGGDSIVKRRHLPSHGNAVARRLVHSKLG